MNGLVAILMLSVAPVAADEYPIAPVDVVLRAEPDRLVADVDSDSIYWLEEVVEQETLPPRDWPKEAQAKAEAYVNAHLRLTVDDHPLTGRLILSSYRQSLGQANEEGRVHLRLVYPALRDGATLAGRATFFEEYRQERLASAEGLKDVHGKPQIYETWLSIPGGEMKKFHLYPGATAFSVPVQSARRTAFELAEQSFGAGAQQLAAAWTAWPALFAVVLSFGGGTPSRARATIDAAALAGGALIPFPAWNGLTWAAGAGAALAAGRWLGEGATPWLEAAALAMVGRAYAVGALADLPGTTPGLFERGLSILGVVAAASVVLALGATLLGFEKKRLSRISETRAAELFARRRRLSATVVGIVCLWGMK